jgi:hypothetical protein
MDPMKNLIKEYLSRPTDYAILISGEWGTGKTHYFQNTLKPFIENEIQAIDSPKNYKVVYVSMFGLSSIEDIQKELFVSLLPLLKNKVIRISGGLGKIIARGVLEFKNLGDIDKYIKDVKKISLTVLELNSVVLCFDDLERLNPKLKFDEFIGYVNSIVDSNQGKVVLISNEDKIKNAKKKFKEKVIGLNIEFNPNNRETVQSIIRSNYEHRQQVFYKFINEYLDLVTDFAERIDLNYRTLNFALEKLLTIHSLWLAPMSEEDKQNDPGLSKKIDFVIRFVIGICHEFRINMISYKNRKDLEPPKDYGLAFLKAFKENEFKNQNKKVDIPKSYKEAFGKKYLDTEQSKFVFITSLYDYITAGAELNVDDLVEMLDAAFYAESQVNTREYELLVRLHDSPFDFSNQEYTDSINEMLEYASNGTYRVIDYSVILLIALGNHNLLKLDPMELVVKLKLGMDKAPVAKREYFKMPEVEVPSDFEFKNELNEIIEHKNGILLKEKEKYANDQARHIVEAFLNNSWVDFKEIYNQPNRGWHYVPLFHQASPNEILGKLLAFSNADIKGFVDLMEDRYRVGDERLYRTESDFICAMHEELKKTINDTELITRILLFKLAVILNHACDRVKQLTEKS